MPITANILTAGGDPIDRQVYTSQIITPPANRLILAWCAVQRSIVDPGSTLTVEGNSLTWTKFADSGHLGAGGRLFCARATGLAPTSGAVTMTYGTTMVNGAWAIVEYAGVDLAQGDQGVIQSVAGVGNDTTPTQTLAAFGSPTHATVGAGALAAFGPPSLTEEAGYTVTSSQAIGQLVLLTEFLASADTTPSMTRSSSGPWAFIGAELAELVGGPSPKRRRLLLMGSS